jgi:hypothetical protein
MSRLLLRRVLPAATFLAALFSLPLYYVHFLMHPADIEGPRICPLPETAEGILRLRLALPAGPYPDFGALAAFAERAGHRGLIADWAKGRTMPADQGSMFGLAPIMDWVDVGARGSVAAMKAAAARITDGRPNPYLLNPPLPPPNHNANARNTVLSSIMVPAMLVNGRVDALLSISPDNPVLHYNSDWGVRFLVSSGAMDKARALYHWQVQTTESRHLLRALIIGLGLAGDYAELDVLRREDEGRALTWWWATIDQIRPVHEALRRGDADTIENDVRSLEDDATKTEGLIVKRNVLTLVRSALLAFHLRRDDWLRAEAQLKFAQRGVYGRTAQEAWLAAAGIARKAGERGIAERWKAEAKSIFCASNPHHPDAKMGGVKYDVLRFLHLLYLHTASEEALLPGELVWQPALDLY